MKTIIFNSIAHKNQNISEESDFTSPEKKVTVCEVELGSPESIESMLNSCEKNKNTNIHKLYEISEIYSTMKINETPECENSSKQNIAFPECIAELLKRNDEDDTFNQLQTFDAGYNENIASNQQNMDYESDNDTYKENQKNKDDALETTSNRKSIDKLAMIIQQNKIIDTLNEEILKLKEQLKQEQKEKFKLAIQIEQLKRSNLNNKVDKAVSANVETQGHTQVFRSSIKLNEIHHKFSPRTNGNTRTLNANSSIENNKELEV